MIKVTCTCGKSFTVDSQYAGRKARCQNCQAAIVIPAETSEPPAMPQPPILGREATAAMPPPTPGAMPTVDPSVFAPGLARGPASGVKWVGFVLGVLTLLTLFIPWGVYETRSYPRSSGYGDRGEPQTKTFAIMSWHIIGNYSPDPSERRADRNDDDMPSKTKVALNMVRVMMVGMWTVGLVSALLSLLLPAYARSLATGAAGLLGFVLVLAGVSFLLGGSRSSALDASLMFSPLNILGGLLVWALIVITHLRRRLGHGRGMAIGQVGVSAAIIPVLIVLMILMILAYPDTSSLPDKLATAMVLGLVGDILGLTMLAAAVVMSLVMGLAGNRVPKAVTVLILAALYTPLAIKALLAVTLPAYLSRNESWSVTLLMLNLLFMIGPMVYFLVAGIVGTLSRVAAPVDVGT